ncbi:MAG TPA: membrane dipeptidase [Bryobacteraceae bacterium]|nr:membrane dipeptidase [Bryobacteraceae bacterium]
MISRRTLLRGAALSIGAPFLNRGRFALFAQSEAAYSALTLDLVRASTVIDMLGLLTLDFHKLSAWRGQPGRFHPADLQRLKDSGITVFHPAVGYTEGNVYSSSLRDITAWNEFIAAHPDGFLRVDRAADLERAKTDGKIGILIGQQNSSHFRTADDVNVFYGLGQRVSQLTYERNRIGGGSGDAWDGLTEYGAQIVERMNKLGMAIDVSHCADRTTLDAVEASRKPVLITHSNCRALVPGSARCKTDEAIRSVAAKGGVIGITMVRYFVRSGGPATIEDVLDHIDHVVQLAGVEHVGLGTDVDLDGRDVHIRPKKRQDLDGIDYAKKVYDLTEGLVRRKYSRKNIELILGGNFQRTLGEIWSGVT